MQIVQDYHLLLMINLFPIEDDICDIRSYNSLLCISRQITSNSNSLLAKTFVKYSNKLAITKVSTI